MQTSIVERLECWASWYHSGRSPLPPRLIAMYGPLILNRFVGCGKDPERRVVPFNEGEARQTNEAVKRLEIDLYLTVHEYWLLGGTNEDHAMDLDIGVQTFYDRLQRAYAELTVILDDIAA